MSNNKKNKVFVVADIGLEDNQAYHVGDEAMFLSNVKKYKKLGNWEVSCSSRSISHGTVPIKEFFDIYITSSEMYLDLIKKTNNLFKTGVNEFPEFFKPTIQEILNTDLIHISGGGNITTLWKGHIYYRCFIINLAKLWNKKVIVTGQTIGEIKDDFCREILKEELNKVDFLGVRDRNSSKRVLKEIGVQIKPITMIDDAYIHNHRTMQSINNKQNDDIIRVGLSLHDWKQSSKLEKSILKSLEKIINNNSGKKIELHIISHYLDNKDQLDTAFMLKIITNLKNVKNKTHSFSELNKKEKAIADIIYQITGQMDILLTTRYHGLVFGLSQNIPTLALNLDSYYKVKNNGFLNFFKNDDFELSALCIQKTSLNPVNIFNKLQFLIDNKTILQKLLRKQNIKISKTLKYPTLDKIIKSYF